MDRVTIRFLPITNGNTCVLQHVSPEVFDDIIDLSKVEDFVQNDLHCMIVATAEGLVIGQIRGIVHLQPDGPRQ